MASVRVLTLATFAAIALAGTAVMTFAQPGSDGGRAPAPATAPKDPPTGDRPEGPRPEGMRGQPGGEGRGPRGEGGGTKQGMSTMNRAMRTLQNQISDAAKKDENLKLLNDVERGAVAAKGAPLDRMLAKIEDAAKRAETATLYRRSLITVVEKALKAETALMDGKTAEAAALVNDIVKLRDDTHKTLGVKEEKGEGRGERGERGGPEGPGGR